MVTLSAIGWFAFDYSAFLLSIYFYQKILFQKFELALSLREQRESIIV